MNILLAAVKAKNTGGGVASYNWELVNLLAKNNRIDLLTEIAEPEAEGFSRIISSSEYNLNNVQDAKKLVTEINNGNYDVIISSASNNIPVLAPFLNAPIVSVSHFVNGRLAVKAGYNQKYINAIISLSYYGKKFIEERFHINDKQKIHIVYNFVKSKPADFRLKIDRKPLMIVYPGGTSVKKSPDVIQNLLYKMLETDLPFDFYWLGGTRLPISKISIFRLRDLRNLFKVDRRLHITGNVPREDAEKLMMDANIFLLPSRGEGCPMTLLEAMRGGCIPIVSDAKHGSVEIIEDSKAGLIVKQDNSDELYKVIRDIILNHSSYESYYSKSREYLSSSLSQEVWSEKMKDVISYAISHKKEMIEFNKKELSKSLRGYKRLLLFARIKEMASSLKYRLVIDDNYLMHKLGRLLK